MPIAASPPDTTHFPTAPEFHAEFAESFRLAGSMGGTAFVQGLLAGSIDRSGSACLCGAQMLLRPDAKDPELSAGLALLAEAFARRGHIDSVALAIRRVFAYCQDDGYETDRRRAFFCAKLSDYGAGAGVARFDRLVDGSDHGKIFVVGCNRTGTTAIQHALQNANILCGPQALHEKLLRDWAQRRWDRIADLCRYFEAFQDYPFALPFTFQAMDQAFSEARFILSIRDSPEQWYESLVEFESKVLFGGRQASWEAIDAQDYCYPGFVADASRLLYRWQDYGLYDRKRAIDLYRRHNDDVQEYFHHRPGKLLVINVAGADSYPRFAAFLGLPAGRQRFDRVNTR